MGETLNSHDHGNCELCDLLEIEQAALEAKLEAMERAGRGLLHVLPDSLFHARIEDDDSWEWCWNELSGHAQDHVKAAREAWAAAQQEKEDE